VHQLIIADIKLFFIQFKFNSFLPLVFRIQWTYGNETHMTLFV